MAQEQSTPELGATETLGQPSPVMPVKSWFSTLKPLNPKTRTEESSLPPSTSSDASLDTPASTPTWSAEDVKTQLTGCLEKHAEFMTLSSLLELTAVQWLPSDTSQLTFLAPTNLAFSLLPPGRLEWYLAPEHQVELVTLLQYHSIPELGLDQLPTLTTRQKTVLNKPKNLYGKAVLLKKQRLAQRLKSGGKDTVSVKIQGATKLTTAYYSQALTCETSPAITILPIMQVITPKP